MPMVRVSNGGTSFIPKGKMLTKYRPDSYSQRYYFTDIPTSAISAYNATIIMNGSDIKYAKANVAEASGYKVVASCLKDQTWTYKDIATSNTDVSGYDYVMFAAEASGFTVTITRA